MNRFFVFVVGLCALTVQAQVSKFSPNLTSHLVQTQMPQRGQRSQALEAETFRAMIVSTDVQATLQQLEQLDVQAASIGCDILTATLPFAALEQIAAIKSISSIEMGGTVQPTLLNSRNHILADRMHTGLPAQDGTLTPYTGKGVILGVVDCGFEYGHAAFYDREGNFRIKRVWEQQTSNGRRPQKFGYGSELLSETEILNSRYDNTAGTHGTHVTGCAAGSDYQSGFYGMAPDADIVIVAASSVAQTPQIVDGVRYIFDYAESVGKPCVINLSLGSHYGPHDGTSVSDRAFDEMVGPGRLIVGAAGNEGDINLHISKTFTDTDRQLKTTYGFSSSQSMSSLVDVWGDPSKTYKVSLIVADNLRGQIVYQSESVSSDGTTPLTIEMSNTLCGATGYVVLTPKPENSNGRQNVYVETHLTDKQANRNVGLLIEGEAGTTVHAWNCSLNSFVSNGRPGWTAGTSSSTIDEIGGTGRSVISVGAYGLRDRFTDLLGDEYILPGVAANTMGFFSSRGPTLDGRCKPDVVAPGVLICGPVSKHYYGTDARYNMEHNSTTDGGVFYYYPMTGTSMASPIVAGTVACWLQARPTLTVDECLSVMKETSSLEGLVYTYPEGVGYGYLNAYAGLSMVADADIMTGTDAVTVVQTPTAPLYDLQGRKFGPHHSTRGLFISQGRKILR